MSDERLKLLAPILATYLSQRDTGGSSSFNELCAGLSTSLDDPFMRAIFAYLATGDWKDVLEEDALPLKDRIGVALRFLPDEEVSWCRVYRICSFTADFDAFQAHTHIGEHR